MGGMEGGRGVFVFFFFTIELLGPQILKARSATLIRFYRVQNLNCISVLATPQRSTRFKCPLVFDVTTFLHEKTNSPSVSQTPHLAFCYSIAYLIVIKFRKAVDYSLIYTALHNNKLHFVSPMV